MDRKNTLLSIATVLMLTGAILFPANLSVKASEAPNPAAGQRMKERREGHPDIEAAIRHLQAAKESMEKAQRTFGGHRGNALKLTNQAIQELRDAVKFADKR
jgi:hypothetical protein